MTLEQYENLIDEIADVSIMLNQVIHIFLISIPEIESRVDFKHKRMEEMLKKT